MAKQYTDITVGDSAYSLLNPGETKVVEQAISILEAKLLQGDTFSSPAMVKQYCQLQLASKRDEVFGCLFLTSQNQLIGFEKLFYGTIDGASVHPRIVVRRALELNAAAVIFTHNHPSGISEPSTADQQITSRLRESLSLIDVRVLDHIVVGCTDSISMAELGRL
jgi:DNA repair protein RadC